MRTILSALAAAAVLSAMPASAQQKADMHPGTQRGYDDDDDMTGKTYGPGMMMQGWGAGSGMMNAPGRGRFTLVDVNEDGVISAEEAASAADQVFTAMDSDDDGSVTREEYMAVRMGTGSGWNAERQAARQTAKEARFADMDHDKNGAVSKAEFIDGAQAHFDAADTDKNGAVSPWEFRRQAWD
jgi:Ca2+-binding EF-hand superfamily protein